MGYCKVNKYGTQETEQSLPHNLLAHSFDIRNGFMHVPTFLYETLEGTVYHLILIQQSLQLPHEGDVKHTGQGLVLCKVSIIQK